MVTALFPLLEFGPGTKVGKAVGNALRLGIRSRWFCQVQVREQRTRVWPPRKAALLPGFWVHLSLSRTSRHAPTAQIEKTLYKPYLYFILQQPALHNRVLSPLLPSLLVAIRPPSRTVETMTLAAMSSRKRQRQQHRCAVSISPFGLLVAIPILAMFSCLTTTTASFNHPAFTPPATADSAIFSGVSDDSVLARTMVGGREGGHRDDPYSIAAPGADAPLRLSHGTTTVALVFQGGVIAAVDSRASMGSFVGSRTTQKV